MVVEQGNNSDSGVQPFRCHVDRNAQIAVGGGFYVESSLGTDTDELRRRWEVVVRQAGNDVENVDVGTAVIGVISRSNLIVLGEGVDPLETDILKVKNQICQWCPGVRVVILGS